MTTEVKNGEKTNGILSKEYHGRLLEDIERYASVANVRVSMVHEPMSKYCPPEEVKWFKNIMLHRDTGVAGLCLTGLAKGYPVETRMMAMAAALLRNYVDARVLTTITLLEEHKAGEVEDPTVLLIPNFYSEYSGGKTNMNWQVNVMQDLLMRRFVEQKLTIIYVQSIEGLKAGYGENIGAFIEANWKIL